MRNPAAASLLGGEVCEGKHMVLYKVISIQDLNDVPHPVQGEVCISPVSGNRVELQVSAEILSIL